MDTIGIAVIVIAMIAGGMAIKIYQERRYFYLSTFFYKESPLKKQRFRLSDGLCMEATCCF